MQSSFPKIKNSHHLFLKGLATLSLSALAVIPAAAQEPELEAGIHFFPGNLVVSRSVYDKVAEFDREGGIPGRAKLAAGLSLVLWISIACMGRGIGYIEPPMGIHAELFHFLHL